MNITQHKVARQLLLRLLILLTLLLPLLASCASGHTGGNEIAFLRDGHLWTIDPNGTNAFALVNDALPVLSYSWSPSHHILVYRQIDPTFAKTAAGKHIESNPLTMEPGDLPSGINTIGINGGTPIPTMFSSANISYSNPFWNANGHHVIYRQDALPTDSPDAALWLVSQDDQPGGIATQTLPRSYSIPSIADGTNTTIENYTHGAFTTTLAGTKQHTLIQGNLPGHPLPATLERLLWQPAHQQPALLYAITSSSSIANMVQLRIRSPSGQTTTLATCQCTQFAWSPDGNAVLYSTGTNYTILDLLHKTSVQFNGEADSIPYWSPDSHFLLLDSLHTLSLISVTTGQKQRLLSDAAGASQAEAVTLPGVDALLHPIPNTIWASDSTRFLFLTRGRTLWQGRSLSSKSGLYIVTITDKGQIQGQPALVDRGNDSQGGWGYENPNTSFLFA